MSDKAWETGVPVLPIGFTFKIEVVAKGTYVRVFDCSLPRGSIAILESFVDGQYHEPREQYLAKVWNAANQLANFVKDMVERRNWILNFEGIR